MRLFAIDRSGSTALNVQNAILADVAKRAQPGDVACAFDTSVYCVVPASDAAKIMTLGGGGTLLDCVMVFAKQQNVKAVTIYSDCYAEAPKTNVDGIDVSIVLCVADDADHLPFPVVGRIPG